MRTHPTSRSPSLAVANWPARTSSASSATLVLVAPLTHNPSSATA